MCLPVRTFLQTTGRGPSVDEPDFGDAVRGIAPAGPALRANPLGPHRGAFHAFGPAGSGKSRCGGFSFSIGRLAPWSPATYRKDPLMHGLPAAKELKALRGPSSFLLCQVPPAANSGCGRERPLEGGTTMPLTQASEEYCLFSFYENRRVFSQQITTSKSRTALAVSGGSTARICRRRSRSTPGSPTRASACSKLLVPHPDTVRPASPRVGSGAAVPTKRDVLPHGRRVPLLHAPSHPDDRDPRDLLDRGNVPRLPGRKRGSQQPKPAAGSQTRSHRNDTLTMEVPMEQKKPLLVITTCSKTGQHLDHGRLRDNHRQTQAHPWACLGIRGTCHEALSQHNIASTPSGFTRATDGTTRTPHGVRHSASQRAALPLASSSGSSRSMIRTARSLCFPRITIGRQGRGRPSN